ncbi:hypothetical protein KGF54_002009 [Candida jiufengensis]|uniref:uncharacterized protein n=1 Tax=Candida jiufengensis TaxID=497108 RepID=UPI00222542FC|nr:uncharacterized protein KGF54_002009 [Candida jiufengensis]KAI5954234.1 hypothetical protein KGF54_002009 [Candida jiufengensis]
MNIFLKLPKEVLTLIIKYINNDKTLEILVGVKPLQQYALRERYSDFKISTIDGSQRDGSAQYVKDLYYKFKFKPTKISGKIDDIKELIKSESVINVPKKRKRITRSSSKEVTRSVVDVNYGDVEFELLLDTSNTFAELKSVWDKINVVGIHMGRGGVFDRSDFYTGNVNFNEEDVHNFIKKLETSEINSLTTFYSRLFNFPFPESLKTLTLYKQKNKSQRIDLRNLNQLEQLNLEGLGVMESLDELKIPESVKILDINTCEMKYLNNLNQLINLKVLTIKHCGNFIGFLQCLFPESLKELTFFNTTLKHKINQLFKQVEDGTNDEFKTSDFSSNGELFIINSKFRFPSKLKKLHIHGSNCFALESNESLTSLDDLNLDGMKLLDLAGIFAGLSNKMENIKIDSCKIAKVVGECKFPRSKQITFSNNKIEALFETNLNQMDYLEFLDFMFNQLDVLYGRPIVNPITFFNYDSTFVDKASGKQSKKTTKSSKSIEPFSVTLNMPNLEQLMLHRETYFSWERRRSVYQNDFSNLSQISLAGCGKLTKFEMSGLGFKNLNLNCFPISLKSVYIHDFSFNTIIGIFSTLNNLRDLKLRNVDLSYSMLSNQTFPDSLKKLDLSNNRLEDLTCLYISNCKNLTRLILDGVTGSKEPKGAIELRDLFLKLNIESDDNLGVLTNYSNKNIFRVVDGVDVTRGSGSKRSSRARPRDDDPAYR